MKYSWRQKDPVLSLIADANYSLTPRSSHQSSGSPQKW